MGRIRLGGRENHAAAATTALADARSDLAATTAAVERLADVHTVERAVEVALEVVCTGFGWSYGSYWSLDPAANVLRFAAQHGQVDGEFAAVTASATFAEGVGLSGRAWARRELVFVPDLGELTDCVRAPAAQRAGVRSGICFPVFQDGRVVGTMDFFTLETLDPAPSRLQALRSIAVVVSQALERVADLERQRKAAQDVTAVTAMLRGAMAATTEEQALADALDTIRREFDWTYGSYWRLDDDAQVLTFVLESGDAGAEFREVTLAATFAHGVGLSGRAWARGELVFVEDLGELHDCVRAPAAQRAGVRSGVCFPILVEGRVVGTMDFFATRTLVLSESRRAALRNTGYLLGQTLERLAAARRLETAGRELVASIEEVERNVVVATEVASRGQQTVVGTDREVADLGRASREISKVVKVITGIAAQTNLLALNATIEAARAGDAGRGFAVVAGEVKDLATETAKATTDVDARVQAIQSRVDSVTVALSDIRELVEQINATQTVISGVLTEQVAVTRAILG